MNQTNYKTVIIGAGIAGINSAINLKKNGIDDICIIERLTFPRIKACTGILTPASYQLLKENEIDPIKDLNYIDINDETELELYYKDKFITGIEFNCPFYFPNEATRGCFDMYFYNKAKSNGIEIRESNKIHDIDLNKRVISVNDKNLSYETLIFADGTSGFSKKYSQLKEKYICIEAVFNKISDKPFYKVFLGITKGGYAWISNSRENCSIGFSDVYDININYLKILSEFAYKHGYDISNAKIRGAFIPMHLPKNFLLNDNTILTGDAAGLTNPFSMEGIYQALESGKQAALSIKEENILSYTSRIKSLVKEKKLFLFINNIFYNTILQKPLLNFLKINFIKNLSSNLLSNVYLKRDSSISKELIKSFNLKRKL